MKCLRLSNRNNPRILSEPILRQHSCAFSGHRPEKVYGSEGRIIVELRKEIIKAIADGYRVFLSGMSRGVDIWAADIVIELRRYNKDLKLICVVPYTGVEESWSVDWQKHYKMVLKQADFIHVLSDHFSPGIYQKRNQWLVNHSSRLIAVYNGERSGTENTIEYAQEQGIPVDIIKVCL